MHKFVSNGTGSVYRTEVRETTIATFNPMSGRSKGALTMIYIDEKGNETMKFCVLPPIPWISFVVQAITTLLLLLLFHRRSYSKRFLLDTVILMIFGVFIYYFLLVVDYLS
jgi:hypothetical protein